MKKIILEIKKFMADEEGVTAIEYGLLASLIAVAIAATVSDLGQSIKNVFTSIATALGPKA